VDGAEFLLAQHARKVGYAGNPIATFSSEILDSRVEFVKLWRWEEKPYGCNLQEPGGKSLPHEEGTDDVWHVYGGLVRSDLPIEGEEEEREHRLVEQPSKQIVQVGVVSGRANSQHHPHSPPQGIGVAFLGRQCLRQDGTPSILLWVQGSKPMLSPLSFNFNLFPFSFSFFVLFFSWWEGGWVDLKGNVFEKC
jgi:hypothetical protein